MTLNDIFKPRQPFTEREKARLKNRYNNVRGRVLKQYQESSVALTAHHIKLKAEIENQNSCIPCVIAIIVNLFWFMIANSLITNLLQTSSSSSIDSEIASTCLISLLVTTVIVISITAIVLGLNSYFKKKDREYFYIEDEFMKELGLL